MHEGGIFTCGKPGDSVIQISIFSNSTMIYQPVAMMPENWNPAVQQQVMLAQDPNHPEM